MVVSPRPTLGQVLRPVLADAPASLRLSPHQGKTLRMLAVCRTAALGGQAFDCPHCEREHVVAHRCRNRHCPQCQGAQAMAWLERQAQGQLEFHGQLAVLAPPVQFAALLRKAARSEWVVYAKRPFAGPRQVLAYLSRYTHRVALSPRRLLATDGPRVTFAYKDYAEGAQTKRMTLSTTEFVRRFGLHVLPERFVKIRH